jgi:outer membrane protein assembly factor BamB
VRERALLYRDNGFVELSWRAGDTKLTAQIGSPADKKIRTIHAALPAKMQGTPALGDGFVLLPLANGILARLNLADGALINGADWRAIGAEEQTSGHITLISNTDFIATDGSRGLQRIHSAEGKNWEKRASYQLSHRIITTPLVIPGPEKSKASVCVLDASDTLTLLDAERLTVLRTWPLGAKVTAGPFVRDGKIGVVAGKNRLVWIDPAEANATWEYAFVADVVGEPQLIDGMLVVGDVAGQFIGLDPKTGRPLGPGVTLQANVAPTASPLPFGDGRAFAPLTDGTIVLVPLEKLRSKEE